MIAANVLGQSVFDTSDSATTQSGMSNPLGLAYDSLNKKLFVVDSYNNRVLVYNLTSGITNGMIAANVLGQSAFDVSDSATTQNGLNTPRGLAYDSASKRLFVVDQSNYRVLVYDLTSGITDGMNAANVLGQVDFTASVWPEFYTTKSISSSAEGVTYDSTNNLLYVFDNSRIMIFSAATLSNNQEASNFIGMADYVTTVSGPTAASVSYGNLIYDNDNAKLFVVDSSKYRVLVFSMPKITTSSLANATTSEVYSASITASGGTTPYECSLSSGSLPAGLTLSSACAISGTPTTVGIASFTIKLLDNSAPLGFSIFKDLSLTVASSSSSDSGGDSDSDSDSGSNDENTTSTSGGSTIIKKTNIDLNMAVPPETTDPKAGSEQDTNAINNSDAFIKNLIDEINLLFNQATPVVTENKIQAIVDKIIDKADLTIKEKNSIINFIINGTPTTIKLGAGERGGVLNSYKSVFGKLPTTQGEWSDAIKIANGRWPSQKNLKAETAAVEAFKKIYKRSPDMSQNNDNAAVIIMAYGLRPSPRNINSEKAAIRSFKAIYKHTPTDTADWDIVRAIAYSGASVKIKK
jgi:hypothetical protein